MKSPRSLITSCFLSLLLAFSTAAQTLPQPRPKIMSAKPELSANIASTHYEAQRVRISQLSSTSTSLIRRKFSRS
jgi:hypothetical protein